MGVLKWKTTTWKARFVDQVYLIKGAEKEVKKSTPREEKKIANACDVRLQMLEDEEQEKVQEEREYSDHKSFGEMSGKWTRIERKEYQNETFKNPVTTFEKMHLEFTHNGEELNERLIEEVTKRIGGFRVTIPIDLALLMVRIITKSLFSPWTEGRANREPTIL